jgi:iron complex transport system substrate-binding protein
MSSSPAPDAAACAEAAAAWLAAFGAHDTAPAALGVAFAPATFKQVLDGALALGRAAGRLPEAMRVLAEGEARLQRVRDRLGLGRADREGEGLPRVAVVGRLQPLVLAGRWVPDLVAHAGGRAVLTAPGQPARPASWDEVIGVDPDVLVLALRGRPAEAAREDLRRLTALPEWSRLRTRRVLAFEGALLRSPGPGLVEAVERLAAALHPGMAEPEGSDRR